MAGNDSGIRDTAHSAGHFGKSFLENRWCVAGSLTRACVSLPICISAILETLALDISTQRKTEDTPTQYDWFFDRASCRWKVSCIAPREVYHIDSFPIEYNVGTFKLLPRQNGRLQTSMLRKECPLCHPWNERREIVGRVVSLVLIKTLLLTLLKDLRTGSI